jgi:hypothetical protein
VTAEHAVIADISRVADVAGDGVGCIAEPVVVVVDGDDRAGADQPDLAGPGRGQRLDGVFDKKLEGVQALRGVGEIADRQGGDQGIRGQRCDGHDQASRG